MAQNGISTTISTRAYITLADLQTLKNKQDSLFKDISTRYLSVSEILKNYNIHNPENYIEKYYPDRLICINRDGKNWSGIKMLFSIEEAEKKAKQREHDKKTILNKYQTRLLYSTVESAPHGTFLELKKELGLEFSENARETETLWFKYVERKLKKTVANFDTKAALVSRLIKITELIILNTFEKEIYSFTWRELNLIYFNDLVMFSYKQEIQFFLNSIKGFLNKKQITIDFSKLKFPLASGNATNDKEIYSIDEYIKYIDYVSDIELHKSKAINEIRNLDTNYCHYASSWLYVLLHLNNAWRHYDIAQFPRIDLSRTEISNIEWLENNEISIEDARKIIAQIKAMPLIHSKTGKKRYFFCSEELELPFAYAAAICQLRCDTQSQFSEYLIDFDWHRRIFKVKCSRNFFKHLEVDLQFESLKMNRTLISYIYNVIKKITNRNPMEITKLMRSHSDEEITNIYILLTREHLDFLTKQLFDVGHFGYTYELLGILLFGNSPEELIDKSSRSMELKKIFGDIYQVERIAGYLMALMSEKNTISELLKGYELSKIKKIYNLIKLGQQPAKELGYQCIFKDCHFPERSCSKCQCSVPNLYALSSLVTNLNLRIHEYKTKFSIVPEGEKTRITNLLYAELFQLKEAITKFGDSIISEFFEGGLDSLRDDLASLPSGENYISIK